MLKAVCCENKTGIPAGIKDRKSINFCWKGGQRESALGPNQFGERIEQGRAKRKATYQDSLEVYLSWSDWDPYKGNSPNTTIANNNKILAH